jgi:hypothetical protein
MASLQRPSRRSHRPYSPAGSADGDKSPSDPEGRFFGLPGSDRSKRFSEASLADVADRHLRDKTDAIAHIIRNISDQCAAAVEGLQLAHNAEHEAEPVEHHLHSDPASASSEAGDQLSDNGRSDHGSEDASSVTTNPKHSSMPPTPDLVHNRSSTAMSIMSASTLTDRNSLQYLHAPSNSNVHTKIAEGDEESERGSDSGQPPLDGSPVSKAPVGALLRPEVARVVS